MPRLARDGSFYSLPGGPSYFMEGDSTEGKRRRKKTVQLQSSLIGKVDEINK